VGCNVSRTNDLEAPVNSPYLKIQAAGHFALSCYSFYTFYRVHRDFSVVMSTIPGMLLGPFGIVCMQQALAFSSNAFDSLWSEENVRQIYKHRKRVANSTVAGMLHVVASQACLALLSEVLLTGMALINTPNTEELEALTQRMLVMMIYSGMMGGLSFSFRRIAEVQAGNARLRAIIGAMPLRFFQGALPGRPADVGGALRPGQMPAQVPTRRRRGGISEGGGDRRIRTR
jgi:hypothetical protein